MSTATEISVPDIGILKKRSFREYHALYQLAFADEIFVAWVVSNKISYAINRFFLTARTTPNRITGLMMAMGLVGACFLNVQNVFGLWTGLFFLHVWFALDCWDGEVARQLRKFSRYGREFDFINHLVVHPIALFGLSVHASQFPGVGWAGCVLLFYAFLETVNRGFLLLEFSRNQPDLPPGDTVAIGASGTRRRSRSAVFRVVVSFFYSAPNFLLIAPLWLILRLEIVLLIHVLGATTMTVLFLGNGLRKRIQLYLSAPGSAS